MIGTEHALEELMSQHEINAMRNGNRQKRRIRGKSVVTEIKKLMQSNLFILISSAFLVKEAVIYWANLGGFLLPL